MTLTPEQRDELSVCSVDGCDRAAHCRTWCRAHYKRWKKNGSVNASKPLGPRRDALQGTTPEARFWAKVEKDEGGCWKWQGAKSTDGYGNCWVDGVSMRAHRYSWELAFGPIPDGLVLDHLCRVRSCVNPGHLEPVTSAVNSRRGFLGWASPHRKRPTHCPHGHEYAGENVYIRINKAGNPERKCRACARAARPARTAREAAARRAAREEAA